MIINASGGGGGVGLNFTVVGGATQPTSPSENTIWVNTNVGITDYYFGVTAPLTPAEGWIWFATGTRSPVAFNALKKGNLWTYPTACQQYVSGAWVDKTAKTYINGQWIDYILYLYDRGTEYPDITGDLTCVGTTINGVYGAKTAPTVTKTSTGMTIKWYREASGTTNDSGIAYYAKAIDFTNYSKLYINLEHTQSTNYIYVTFGYYPSIPEYFDQMTNMAGSAYVQRRMNDATWDNIEFDISNVTGSRYIVIGAFQEIRGIDATAGITSIYLSVSAESGAFYSDGNGVYY